MKASMIWIVLVFLCIGICQVVGAQAPSLSGKAPAGQLPRPACKALETYIAKIDAASSQADPRQRSQRYEEAKAQVAQVLERYGLTSVLVQANLYATSSEQTVTKDAADSNLAEAIEQKLKVRSYLLDLCSDYTLTR